MLATRASALMQWGFKNFDALQLATAELCRAAIFTTVDDRLLSGAVRNKDKLRLRVVDIMDVLKEFSR